jgi:hypothetical protein
MKTLTVKYIYHPVATVGAQCNAYSVFFMLGAMLAVVRRVSVKGWWPGRRNRNLESLRWAPLYASSPGSIIRPVASAPYRNLNPPRAGGFCGRRRMVPKKAATSMWSATAQHRPSRRPMAARQRQEHSAHGTRPTVPPVTGTGLAPSLPRIVCGWSARASARVF